MIALLGALSVPGKKERRYGKKYTSYDQNFAHLDFIPHPFYKLQQQTVPYMNTGISKVFQLLGLIMSNQSFDYFVEVPFKNLVKLMEA